MNTYFDKLYETDEHLKNFIEILAPYINKYKSQKNLELEFRLGNYSGESFNTDIGSYFFKRIKDSLDLSDIPREEQVLKDSFDKAGYRRTEGIEGDSPVLIKKTKLCTIDFKFVGTPFDIRVSFSTEVKVRKFGPEIVKERRKERTSYSHKAWKYELTKVAEDTGTSYEFELEATDNYKRIKGHSPEEVPFYFLHDAILKLTDIAKVCEDETSLQRIELIKVKEF